MFPGEVEWQSVVREYLETGGGGPEGGEWVRPEGSITDQVVFDFAVKHLGKLEVLWYVCNIAYQRGARDASALIGV